MTAEFINLLFKKGQLDFFYASMISSDALLSVEACNNSERMLLGFKEVLPDTEIPEKEKWYELIEDGLKIIRRDRKKLTKK